MKGRNRKWLGVSLLALAFAVSGPMGWTQTSDAAKKANPCNPCAAKKGNPCNPCAAKGNPCNPCAAKKANPCNPCAAKGNPCNPCAAKKANPCNPCAVKAKANPCNPYAAKNPCAANPCNPCAAGGAGKGPRAKARMIIGKVLYAKANYVAVQWKGAKINIGVHAKTQYSRGPAKSSLGSIKPGERTIVSMMDRGGKLSANYVYLSKASRGGNPCNPCAAKGNPCNPCAAKKANPCNPCAAKGNPCNPCAAKKANPCNPCAAKK